MKKINLTIKFVLPLVVALVFFSAILGSQLYVVVTNNAIGNAESLIVDFIQLQATQHNLSAADFTLVDPAQTKSAFSNLLQEIQTSDVVRIKVWAKDGVIVFSDDESLIGQSFSDNENFQHSINGESIVVIKPPVDAENASEVGYEQLMEVYVPITLASAPNETIGVVETYYKLDSINAGVAEAQNKMMTILIIGTIILGFIIWVLLHFFVIRSVNKLLGSFTQLKKTFKG